MLESRKIAHRLRAIRLSALLLGVVSEGGAQEQPRIRVDCSELGVESRASVEARARADLAVKGIFEGALDARCDASTATASFAPPSGTIVFESQPLAATERARVEQLLALIDRITSRVAMPNRAMPVLEDSSAPSTEGLPGDSVADTDDARRSPIGLADAGATWRIRAEAAAAAHYWDPNVVGGLGPRVALGLEFRSMLAVGVSGSIEWALRRPEGMRARATDGAVEGWLRVVPPLSLVVAAGLSQLRVAAPEDWSPTVEKSWSPLLRGRLQWEKAWEPITLTVGPEAQLNARTRRVFVESRESFRLPAFAWGIHTGLCVLL